MQKTGTDITIKSLMAVLSCLGAAEKPLTAGELARDTGLSVQEVQCAIDLLSASPLYVPVYDNMEELADNTETEDNAEAEDNTDPDYNVAYRLHNPAGNKYPQLVFTGDEVMALLDAFRRADSRPRSGEPLTDLKNKLTRGLTFQPPPRFCKGLSHLRTEDKKVAVAASVIEEALLNERRVVMAYQGKNGNKAAPVRLKVCPLALVTDINTGFRYLMACRRLPENISPQFYRLDRIISIGTENRFSYPPGFSPGEYLKQLWGFQASENPVMVKVRFFNEARVISKALHELKHRCPPGKIKWLSDGSFYFTGPVRGMDDFRAWLREFGSSAMAVQPPELREAMLRTARNLYYQYSASPLPAKGRK